tara:strand:+ start:9554 stop:10699 length:1146 start_codon:yes stop_codon:yes gene_type:complete
MDLKELLTKRVILKKDGNKEPLFRFQSDIAKAIHLEVASYKDKESKNIRVYLNQVLKKEGENYKKPLSSEMRSALIEVIKSRLSDSEPLSESIEKEFDEAYEELNKKPLNIQDQSSEYDEFLNWQTNSERILIFDMKPREVIWLENQEDIQRARKTENQIDSDTGDILNTMFDNLLNNYNSDKNTIIEYLKTGQELPEKKDLERNAQTQYQFFLPSFEIAKRSWESHLAFLFHYLEIKSEDITEDIISRGCSFIRDLNKKSNARGNDNLRSFIKVFVVPPFLVTVPLVYYESNEGLLVDEEKKLTQKEALFNITVRDKHLVSISKQDDKTLRFWKSHVYYPIMYDRQNPFNIKEIRFKEVQPHIRRTNTTIGFFEQDQPNQ